MFLGYIFFYFSRKSLVFMAPLMIDELKISIYEIGMINSIFYITYACSKIIGGVIADNSKCKYLMFIGLIFTGLFNVLIGFSSSILVITLFWTLNAFFQGWGWPPITKQLIYYYKKTERGLWWGILSISHNIGGAIIPVIIGFLSLKFLWKTNFFVIGFSCMCVGFFLIWCLNKIYDYHKILFYTVSVESKLTFNIISLLQNKKIFLLCMCYFFIYLIKTCINDWIVLYMINQKEHNLFSASIAIFYFEVGGICGIVVSGWMTDKLIKNRMVFLLISVIFLFLISIAFYVIPVGFKKVEYAGLFVLGFFLFSQQMLLGLIASEVVNKNIACTANGFVGSFAYVGASLAGYPCSLIINVSWNIYFIMIFFCEIILIQILTLFLLNNR
ncbi:MAG TPA: MFS transporter [Candidatus Azoamicus sp. OHIO2]